jgi:chemotaxis protein MotB
MAKCSKVPTWMVTYADMMTLLLCFFVLMLSFAEIDAIRFKRLAGELSKAFGVQREIEVNAVPMGTSAIMRNFSPGRPQPIPFDEIRQKTNTQAPTLAAGEIDSRVEERLDELEKRLEDRIRDAETETNVTVERDGLDIVIRIDEQGNFPSGSAQLSDAITELLQTLSGDLAVMPGYIAIDGHTDNVPITNPRFASNWGLSAMRAAAVADVLLANSDVEPWRVIVRGHADTRPLAPNDTPEHRARNRRVEMSVRSGEIIKQELAPTQGSDSGPDASNGPPAPASQLPAFKP